MKTILIIVLINLVDPSDAPKILTKAFDTAAECNEVKLAVAAKAAEDMPEHLRGAVVCASEKELLGLTEA